MVVVVVMMMMMIVALTISCITSFCKKLKTMDTKPNTAAGKMG
jgi:hypothetical protein